MMLTNMGMAGVLALLVPAQIQEPTKFAPAEVIVRFTSGSEGRQPIEAPKTKSRLDPFLETVSQEIGRPLRFRRVGSGGDLLLGLDVAKLTGRLENALRALPEVESAAAVLPEEGQQHREPKATVRVQVSVDTPELAEWLSRKLDLPVMERARPDGERLFEIDLSALTLDVVERLKRRSDVDYAQPNYTVSLRAP